jgi:hypothetical protein
MSPFGASRHFAATPDVGRFRTEADMNRQEDRLHRSRMTLTGHERAAFAAMQGP